MVRDQTPGQLYKTDHPKGKNHGGGDWSGAILETRNAGSKPALLTFPIDRLPGLRHTALTVIEESSTWPEVFRKTRAHLTQIEIARKLGCSPAAIRDWEQGRRAPAKWVQPLIIKFLTS